MDKSVQLLSDITVFGKYAKYLPSIKRREKWDEICNRYEDMLVARYPKLTDDIKNNMILVRSKRVLPSMRAMQFAGPAIIKNEARIFNCAYLPIDDYRAFSETMFLLLGGTGVGYSVQFHHIDKLPEIRKPLKKRKFLIGDSIEGWADAVRALMKAYMCGASEPVFDFSDIREKGTRLVTAGGKAPGPEPLKKCLFEIQLILDRKNEGTKLTSVEAHDIVCHIANAVLAGGIRRAALISLFSFDDEEMLTCKYGNWWELNEQRGRSNNSAVILRHRIKEDEFYELWKKIQASGSGEPGMYFSNDEDWGANPCCEIALRPFQFCNLTEINAGDVEDQADLNMRAKTAAFFGTLQAGFTDFHYLRDVWRRITEKDALIGVGMTGIASGKVLKLNLKEAANEVKEENKRVAGILGINHAARCTTVKPSGTTSCVLGTSSGIHAWHSDYYIRRIRVGKDEALYTYLSVMHPELVKDDFFRPQQQAVIEIPQKATEGSITREREDAIKLLERVKKFSLEWVKAGHRGGANKHNVSATVSINEDEWDDVGKWMWDNKESFNGLSVLPHDGGTYVQAPFETITKEKYDEMMQSLHQVDLSSIIESDDDTNLAGEAACVAGACEVDYGKLQ